MKYVEEEYPQFIKKKLKKKIINRTRGLVRFFFLNHFYLIFIIIISILYLLLLIIHKS